METIDAGHVIRFPDNLLRHSLPKVKWHICVCPLELYFLRINTKPIFKPHHPLPCNQYTFLDHDSYLELGALLHFEWKRVAGEQNENEPVGRLTQQNAYNVAVACQNVATLPRAHKRLIWENLVDDFSP